MTKTEEFEQKREAMSNAALIGFAGDYISDLAKTYGKSHTMSIPPRITDTDMILSELLRRFTKRLQDDVDRANALIIGERPFGACCVICQNRVKEQQQQR